MQTDADRKVIDVTILLIEDNTEIQNLNRRVLERSGYTVLGATTLTEGRKIFKSEKINLIILDVMLPDGNGIEFCEELRKESNVPILFLSALGKDEEILDGFRSGGDDYLPKPYDLNLMVAKAEAILWRHNNIPETIIKGPLILHVNSNEVSLVGVKVKLTEKEFALLRIFIQRENEVLSSNYLATQVWGGAKMENIEGSLRNTVSRLRKKIEISEYTINGAYGEGYVFELT